MDDDTYPIGRSLARLSKKRSLGVVAAAYVGAIFIGYVVVHFGFNAANLEAVFVGDVAATGFIFLFSMAFANSSLYDPYWSVAPPVISVFLLFGPGSTPQHLSWRFVTVGTEAGTSSGSTLGRLLSSLPFRSASPSEMWDWFQHEPLWHWSLRSGIVLMLVGVWGVRLTANWAYTWSGFAHEDWRYVQMRRDTRGKVPWWLVSGIGIQLMPTIVVFIGMFPMFLAYAGRRPFNVLDAAALVVTAGAIALETAADLQRHRAVRAHSRTRRALRAGLWGRSRHPNYLGEIGFWCGLALFGVAAYPEAWWFAALGPLVMILLFNFVSIPLMEKRSATRRIDWADYVATVPRLLPRPWRRPSPQLAADA